MSIFSERLAALRQRVFGSKAKMAKVTGFSASAISLWESGKRVPNVETAVKLATALGVSADYLLGKTSDPLPYSESSFQASVIPTWTNDLELRVEPRTPTEMKDGQRVTEIPTKQWVKIPILSRISAACAGDGNGLAYVEEDIDSWHWFPVELVGRIDPERLPFIVHVEGDSMENAGIFNGSQVIVNPAETVTDGDSALLCWNRDEVAVKLVYWQADGGVLIRGTNSAYGERRFSKDDLDTGYLQIRGKIMWTGQRPKKMR